MVVAGPEAAGYATSLWTCRWIVDVIRHQLKVVYHPDHVGRLLRACGFSPQRPQPRTKERDDRRVREWIQQDWSRVKKLARRGAWDGQALFPRGYVRAAGAGGGRAGRRGGAGAGKVGEDGRQRRGDPARRR
ncbi:MAG: winged helix-turn-helix domain-containing protein [Candidatus Rokubacteria bacterium]|nr:winged helix-turn-helix domain-containing protein [Candidatus Rokubacteria bacterium]